jgi:hypothetical protein
MSSTGLRAKSRSSLKAFACAAEFEDCIRMQFVTKEYNVFGRYQVSLPTFQTFLRQILPRMRL